MKDSFYSSFENKHRGSRESIKERLNAYMPFVLPFKDIYPDDAIIDLGCGRGEWLQLMQELGFEGKGIDLDEGMLSYCHDLGLNVEKGDVISYLESIPDMSVSIVSSFHLIEHIGFDNVKKLVEESFRILKPGGLLIMETPNPENIIVSTNNFYLDPTHVTPIPSLLLSFLTEHQGFERTKILRLQENKDLNDREDIQLIDVLGGVSPDYSVVAQKKGDSEISNALDTAFSQTYGIGLQDLSTKYHQNIESSFLKRDERISSLDDTLKALSLSKSDLSDDKVNQLESEFNKLSEKFLTYVENENSELKAKVSELEGQLRTEQKNHSDTKNLLSLVYSSTSWKLTSPVRALSRVLRWFVRPAKMNGFKNLPSRIMTFFKRKLVSLAKRVISFLNKKPKLKSILLGVINKLGLYSFAKRVYYKSNSRHVSYDIQNHNSDSESELSPKARAIYHALNKASLSDELRNR